jgi:hypothetical protein
LQPAFNGADGAPDEEIRWRAAECPLLALKIALQYRMGDTVGVAAGGGYNRGRRALGVSVMRHIEPRGGKIK